MVRPSAPPACEPSNSISGVPAKPGCDQPSTTTGSVSAGSPDRRAIVCTPAPGMLNWMTSGPAGLLGVALACDSAWRRLPAPASAVLVTTKTFGVGGGVNWKLASDA